MFVLGPLLNHNVAAMSGSGGGASPTTLDPSSVGGSITFTPDNLTAETVGGSASGTRSTNPITAGAKVYFEAVINLAIDAPTFGIINTSASYTPSFWFATASPNTASACPTAPNLRYNTTNLAIGAGTTGTIVGIAYDDTGKKLYCSLNGTWQCSADPVAGTNGLDCTGLTGTLYAAFQGDSGDKVTFNFGATAYNTAAPTGYGNI